MAVKFSQFNNVSPTPTTYLVGFDGTTNVKILYSSLLSGTTNYVSKWTSSTALGNSQIFDNGTSVGIGTASPSASFKLDVSGFTRLSQTTDNATLTVTGSFNGIQRILLENTSATISAGAGFRFNNDTGLKTQLFLGSTVYTSGANTLFVDGVSSRIEIGSRTSNVDINTVSLGVANTKLRVFNNGNVGVGSNPTDAGYRLDVSGTTRISGTELRLDNATTGTINLYSNTPRVNFFSGGGYWVGRNSTTLEIVSGGTIIQYIGGNQAYQIDASNGHLFRSAISGSAALGRFTTGGNLIVGGTTDAGYKLDVNGTARSVGATYLGTGGNIVTFGTATAQAGYRFTFNGGFIYSNSGIDVVDRISCGNAVDNSAILQATSTTKGFLPPRMTGAQAEAIASPAAGLLVYANNGNGATITSTGWWGYNGSGWVKLN